MIDVVPNESCKTETKWELWTPSILYQVKGPAMLWSILIQALGIFDEASAFYSWVMHSSIDLK